MAGPYPKPIAEVGRRNRRVEILRAGADTRDGLNQRVAGTETATWQWAAVTPAPGTERFASAENAASAPMRFVLRWKRGLLKVTDTLRYEGRRFDIQSVTDVGNREAIEVLAVARGE